MRDIIRLVVVLTGICVACSFALALVKKGTEDRIEYQKLKFIKEPAIKAVLPQYDNDPVLERIKVNIGSQKTITVFPAKEAGKLIAVAYETVGTGYGGPIEIMLAIYVDGRIAGVKVMNCSETPGLGRKIMTEASFTEQFKNLNVESNFAVGSDVQGISGATISSKGTAEAMREAVRLFPELVKELKS